jgi:hypothetical protein
LLEHQPNPAAHRHPVFAKVEILFHTEHFAMLPQPL